MVVIGRTGHGKSETCNSIFMNRDLLDTGAGPNSITRNCKAFTRPVIGREVTIVDTPGLFDTELSPMEITSEVGKCILKCLPGPHAILFVIRLGRFTAEVQECVRRFRDLFGADSQRYMTIVFSGLDQLTKGRRRKTLEQFLAEQPPNGEIQRLLRDCESRYVAFDNTLSPTSYENKQQVRKLFEVVDELVARTGGYYTNSLFEAAAIRDREREERERQREREEMQLVDPFEAQRRAEVGMMVIDIGVNLLALGIRWWLNRR